MEPFKTPLFNLMYRQMEVNDEITAEQGKDPQSAADIVALTILVAHIHKQYAEIFDGDDEVKGAFYKMLHGIYRTVYEGGKEVETEGILTGSMVLREDDIKIH